jgi:hypothetical protein
LIPRWSFRYYGPAGGGGDVRDAYDNGSAKFKGKFLSRLKILAALPVTEWVEPYAKMLKGDCDGLVEIRFKADDVQQRPLGFRSGENEFTILFWAIEKNNKFVPLSACAKAKARKAELEHNEELVHAIWLALE